jgi:hypothetical protein
MTSSARNSISRATLSGLSTNLGRSLRESRLSTFPSSSPITLLSGSARAKSSSRTACLGPIPTFNSTFSGSVNWSRTKTECCVVSGSRMQTSRTLTQYLAWATISGGRQPRPISNNFVITTSPPPLFYFFVSAIFVSCALPLPPDTSSPLPPPFPGHCLEYALRITYSDDPPSFTSCFVIFCLAFRLCS